MTDYDKLRYFVHRWYAFYWKNKEVNLPEEDKLAFYREMLLVWGEVHPAAIETWGYKKPLMHLVMKQVNKFGVTDKERKLIDKLYDF